MSDETSVRPGQSQFTPGPWKADNGDGEYWGVFDENGAGLAYLTEDCRSSQGLQSPDEDRANARLIAAAPELLAAAVGAEASMELARVKGTGVDEAVLRILRAAIAKATGVAR
jgi:hypothetical protein